ncbi:hypothetical protein QFZ98_001717 [Paraburkholderia youngii]
MVINSKDDQVTQHESPSNGFGETPASRERRHWLQGALVLAAVGLTGSATLKALAQSTAGRSDVGQSFDAFMTLSKSLTGKSSLDRAVGERLVTALQKKTPDLAQRVPQLAGALASSSMKPDDEGLALKILAGWYMGIVVDAVITYEQALMFSVVSDTLIVPSYCPNQPGFWASKPIERQS